MRIRTYPLPDSTFYVLLDRMGMATEQEIKQHLDMLQGQRERAGEKLVGILVSSDDIETDMNPLADVAEQLMKPMPIAASTLTFSPVCSEPLRLEIHQHSDLSAEQIADQVQDMLALHREGNFDAENRPRRVKVDPEPVAYSVVEKDEHVVDGCLHPDPAGAQDCLKSLQEKCRSVNDPDPRIVPLYAGVSPAKTDDKDTSNG